LSDSWEFASALRDAKPKFDAAGFKLITIGVGPPSKARNLAENVKLPCHSFAHPFQTSLIFEYSVARLIAKGTWSLPILERNLIRSFAVLFFWGCGQLPFPIECLYADPDRKVHLNSTHTLSF
jgi:hypothetical protein